VLTFLASAIIASELAVGLSASVDIATTEIALRRGGFREANRFMDSETGARVLAKTAATAAVIATSRHLRKRGRKNAARVLCWSVAGLWAGAAIWNLRQLNSGKR